MSLKRRPSSLSSKSYQYLPRTKMPVSPYLSSRSWMPLKILEKVSPFLKLRWPSSDVCERPLPPLLTPIRLRLGLAVDQLAPMESDESNWPSISPMLKLTAKAGLARVDARLTAMGNLALRQNGFADFIDATPCSFLLWQWCFKERPERPVCKPAPAHPPLPKAPGPDYSQQGTGARSL